MKTLYHQKSGKSFIFLILKKRHYISSVILLYISILQAGKHRLFLNILLFGKLHDPNWILVRYKKNKKAFLWTYEYQGQMRINVKVDPEWRDFWRNTYNSVIPGYHQNKEHWNTVILDGSIPDQDIKRMIAESYDLIIGK